ncbi:hydrophobic protein [Kitasatospora sp. HPMI-4]|uniref:hydrophobic protein n=1 Tax=Kitasatospora sp. HPMI-4 TaxID=3448443 RepID=UPI003F194253
MAVLLLVLLLALILGGLGFAVHVLWWIALVVFVLWLVGFAVGHLGGARWYRW